MGANIFFDTNHPARVLVVGDIMLDRYYFGDVSRISPESPVPILRQQRVKETVGGAGNVAANIVTLGGSAHLLCLTGEDEGRKSLNKVCKDYGISTQRMLTSRARCTTIKTRFIASGQQLLRHDLEDLYPTSTEEHDGLLEKFDAALSAADYVVLSDYGKGVVTEEFAQSIIARARDAGVGVLVDPKGTDYRKYRGATGITPNLKELSEAVERRIFEDDEVVEAARQLIEQFDLEFVVATRSERGMTVVERDGVEHLPTKALEVFDVSGAGDTVVAALAIGLARGMSKYDAAQIANVAAGVAVAKQGTARVAAAEVLAELGELSSTSLSDSATKSPDEVRGLIQQWRAEGRSVGFTNGCFDILHVGHVTMLQNARSKCDRLIVGLNSDASVKRLKGPERPVNGVADRAGVLAGLRSVDVVVVFEQDTPLELIKTLEPDVLFKGGDYRLDEVVGGDFVKKTGGRVELIDLVDGRSTTRTIERLRT